MDWVEELAFRPAFKLVMIIKGFGGVLERGLVQRFPKYCNTVLAEE